ncbi:hypothetical protein IQ235_09635 [Oscillatoriales cyanobacterium LEGE 11467]|uniref:Uncharacterized protein n=1 Tax=Zarconia navalis LEGE 11467 TaxID=1828826 RepID=A0A928W0H2_9CYAN|nr:hypothetical protein [Zarconia navalis]MBE9041040.1 hypothetical protein [Zarconia navalis LEGE 11467]
MPEPSNSINSDVSSTSPEPVRELEEVTSIYNPCDPRCMKGGLVYPSVTKNSQHTCLYDESSCVEPLEAPIEPSCVEPLEVPIEPSCVEPLEVPIEPTKINEM